MIYQALLPVALLSWTGLLQNHANGFSVAPPSTSLTLTRTTTTTTTVSSSSRFPRMSTLRLDMSSSSSGSPTLRTAVIMADDDDFNFDPGQGGVRLAKESALLLSGTASTTKGVKPKTFTRYTKVTPVDAALVQSIFQKQSAQILGTGIGKENYQDPGTGTQQIIELAPLKAAQDLIQKLQNVKTLANDSDMKYLVNIVGGDDLQVLEVLDALNLLCQGLLSVTNNNNFNKAKMAFGSLSHNTFALEHVSMTLVAVPQDASTNTFRDGTENAVAAGKVFVSPSDGKYWTVVKDDINNATE